MELSSIHFALYVDGARSVLADASCSNAPTAGGFPCNSSLPSLSRGSHVLELAAFTNNNNTVLESAKSAPLTVVVSGTSSAMSASGTISATSGITSGNTASPSSATFPLDTVVTTGDGIRLKLELVVDGLDTPTALAFAPDGRMFVAERAGRVRIVRDGTLQAKPALTLDDVATSGDEGLLDLTIAPNFDQSHLIYAVYTSVGHAGAPVFSVARFREVADTVADRVVVLTGVAASPAHTAAVLRFGPDGKLYAAFDDSGDPRLGGDLASPNGKVLRLNADGTTPGDQPAASPIYSFPYQSPRSLAWQSPSGLLWVVDSGSAPSTRLVAVTPGKGPRQRSALASSYDLATEGRASALVAYDDRLILSFRDSLLVGADEGRDILRVRIDPQNPAGVVGVDRLLKGVAGNVRAVTVGPEGAIYFATPHAIGRLRPMD